VVEHISLDCTNRQSAESRTILQLSDKDKRIKSANKQKQTKYVTSSHK